MSNANFVKCLVTVPVNISATSITLQAAVSPFVLPPTNGGTLILADSLNSPNLIEVITYSNRSGNVLSGVIRGAEGTTARAWSGNVVCYQSLTAGQYVTDLGTKEPTIVGDAVTKFWSGLKTWRDFATDVRASVLTGLSVATNSTISAADTVLVAIGKLQAQLTNFNGSNITSGTIAAARVATLNQNTTGSSASCTGNAATATALATARTVNGVSFNGTANITVEDATKLPLSGGTTTGTIYSNVSSIIIGQVGGVNRGYLYNDVGGFGFLSHTGNWAARVPFGTTNLEVTGSLTAGGGFLGNASTASVASSLTDSGWITPTLVNGWSHSSPSCAYRKLGKIVYIKGACTGGTTSTVAFTLPAGYRPGVIIRSASTAGAYLVSPGGAIAVRADGTVTLLDTVTGGSGITVSCDISFLVD